MTFAEQYTAARRVSTPLVAVRTFDAASTVRTVKNTLNGKQDETPIIVWDCVLGAKPKNQAGQAVLTELMALAGMDDPAMTVPLNPFLYACSLIGEKDAIIFLSNIHLQLSSNEKAPIIQGIWNLRDQYKAKGNMLVMLMGPGDMLPPELVQDVLVLDEPLPTIDDLKNIVADTFKYASLKEPNKDVVNKAVDALIGLPTFPADQAVAMSLDTRKESVSCGKLDIPALWTRKRTIISQVQGLSFYTGEDSLSNVGGLKNIVEFMHLVMNGKDAPKVILRADEVEKAYAGTGTDMSGVKTEMTGAMASWMDGGGHSKVIHGITYLGLPGVSKSALIYAICNYYKVPCINFDLAGMQSGIVGSSGTNLRTAQATIDAISGGAALMVATCNGIDMLPPEMRRRLGSMGTFFFDAPDDSEKPLIWEIYLKKFGLGSQKLPNDFGWTGAEIKNCCTIAYKLGIPVVQASNYIVPVTRSAKERIDMLRISSSGKYISASYAGIYDYKMQQEPQAAISGRKMRA